MANMLRFIARSLVAILALAPLAARAEQFQEFGDYLVYYNALSADLLPASVAQQYGFVQSPHTGLLNIAVQKKGTTPLPEAVAATLVGTATPLLGQAQPIRFREIKEDDGTVYYLGEFAVASRDTYRFALTITPLGRQQSYELKFSKDYVGD